MLFSEKCKIFKDKFSDNFCDFIMMLVWIFFGMRVNKTSVFENVSLYYKHLYAQAG